MAEEEHAAEGAGHAAKGILGKIIAAHLGPLPLPLVIAGAGLAVILGYEYYKNRSASSAGAQPVAVPVGGVPSGGSSGGGTVATGPDYSGQLAALSTELTGLQTSLTGLGSSLAQQQAALAGLQSQIPASLAAAQAPAAAPPAPLPVYQPAITSISNPYAQSSNLGAASSSAYQSFYDSHFLPGGSSYTQANNYLPAYQASTFYNNPVAYTGPTQASGYNIPVYQPLPQYSTSLPYVENPYYGSGGTVTTSSGLVPSTPYGFNNGQNPASVAGHYVELAGGGGQIWVPG